MSIAIGLATVAEKLGYEAIWQAEPRFARDSLVPLGSYAAVTSQLKLGAGVANIWTRNVVALAMAAATLDELASGRILLGVGAWSEPMASKVGVVIRNPVEAVREVLEVLRLLFSGEEVQYHGEFARVSGARLPGGPARVRLYLGATGQRMLEMGGRVADGVLLNHLTPPEYTEMATRTVREAAARAGRDPESLDLPQVVLVSVGEAEAATEWARELAARALLNQPQLARMAEEAGWLSHKALEMVRAGARPRELAACLDPRDLARVAAVGTPEACLRAMEEYLEAGATSLVIFPAGPEPAHCLQALASAMAEKEGGSRSPGEGTQALRPTPPREQRTGSWLG